MNNIEFEERMRTNIGKYDKNHMEILNDQLVGYTSQCKHCFQCGHLRAMCTNNNNKLKFCIFDWYTGGKVPDEICPYYEKNDIFERITDSYFINRQISTFSKLGDKKFHYGVNDIGEFIYKPALWFIVGAEETTTDEEIIEHFSWMKLSPVKKNLCRISNDIDLNQIESLVLGLYAEDYRYMLMPNVCLNFNANTNFFEDVKECIESSVIRNKTDLVTKMIHSKTISENKIMNLSWINNSYWAYDFKDSCKDKTILCIGGGPSLNDQIKIIKDNREKFIIFTPTTTARILFDNGIIPDIISTIDMKSQNKVYIDRLSEEEQLSTTLLFDIDANWETINSFKGKKIFLYSQIDKSVESEPFREIFKIDKSLDRATNVSNYILKFAIYCNPNKIILSGYDMCYPTGKSHADGTEFNEDIEILNDDIAPIIRFKKTKRDMQGMFLKNNQGEDVITSVTFYTYFKELNDIIHSSDIEIVDTSPIGLKKNCRYGIIEDELKLIDNYENNFFNNILLKKPTKYFNNKIIKNAIKSLKDEPLFRKVSNDYLSKLNYIWIQYANFPYINDKESSSFILNEFSKQKLEVLDIIDNSLKLLRERGIKNGKTNS